MTKLVILSTTALALVLFGFTVGQLADGVSEMPNHWWSMLSAAVTACALGASTAVLGLDAVRDSGGRDS